MITELRSPHGRQAHTGPQRVHPSQEPLRADETLRLIRGLTFAVLLSLPIWAVIGWVIWTLV